MIRTKQKKISSNFTQNGLDLSEKSIKKSNLLKILQDLI